MSSPSSFNTSEYQIAWIAALPVERAAAEAVLDQRHGSPADFTQHDTDHNAYSWGTISGHNIVIASLPLGIYGLASATTTAQGLVSSLPSVRIGLLVGIGAAFPENGLDIRLGDIAVSKPQGTIPGVLQYDFGKANANGQWERIGFLCPPPPVLLNAMGKLQAEHELQESRVSAILEEASEKNPKFAANYLHPGMSDRLIHTYWNGHAMIEEERKRPERSDLLPQIHYGIIASGNTLVKDAETRAAIFAATKQPCICLEMEAAGLMNNFPCLVIRGICDYADSHKNDDWHRYASATAAAFAKELLYHVPQFELGQTQRIGNLLGNIQSGINDIKANLDQKDQRVQDDERAKFMQALDTCPYRERKNRNPTRVKGTCEWVVNHQRFINWQNGHGHGLLWISADPGCGKSVLARHLIEDILPASSGIVCYFFFKDDFIDQNNFANAICALLRQLLRAYPEVITPDMMRNFNNDRNSYVTSIQTLWEEFINASGRAPTDEIVCVLDALDECQEKDRRNLINSICEYAQSHLEASKVKFLVTSRPYIDIKDGFYDFEEAWPTIHLSGEDDAEVKMISQEISAVMRHRIKQFSKRRRLTPSEELFLMNEFTSQAQRTYLWADLTLDVLERTPEFSKGAISKMIHRPPNTLDEAYNNILNRSLDRDKAKLLLQLIVAAQHPFSLDELSRMMALDGDQESFSELDDYIEPEERFKITIRNLCGFMVVVVDTRVYLLHQTAREFLVSKKTDDTTSKQYVATPSSWKASLQPTIAHRALAERCLWLLTLRTRSEQSSDASILALLEYSDYFWPSHFMNSNIVAGDRLFDIAIAHSYIMYPYHRKLWGILIWSMTILGKKLRQVEIAHEEGLRLVETYQRDGDRYLNSLSFAGLSKIITWLLDNTTFITGREQVLSRALYWAALGGHVDTAQLLLNLGASPNLDVRSQAQRFERLMRTSETRRLCDSSKFYESNCVTGSIKPTETLPTLMTVTPLHSAVHRQDQLLVTSLLSNGAQIDAVSAFENQTPLHFAARLCNDNIIRLLLDHGADKKARDKFNYGPLENFFVHGAHGKNCSMIHRLLWYDSSEISNDRYRLLILAGINCTTCALFAFKNSTHLSEDDQQMALLKAIQWGEDNVAKQFIEVGVNVNTPDKNGVTLLMHAASRANDSSFIMKYMLEQGANIYACDCKGASCIHYVRNEGALDVLLAHGANINAKDHSDVTPLLQVVLDVGRSALYNAILKRGANPDIKDKYGLSAQSLTVQSSEPLRGRFSRSSYESTQILASINLCDCLDNVNGTFSWKKGGNFFASARNIRLLSNGTVLAAELKDDGDSWKSACIQLDERITNSNGVLKLMGPP